MAVRPLTFNSVPCVYLRATQLEGRTLLLLGMLAIGCLAPLHRLNCLHHFLQHLDLHSPRCKAYNGILTLHTAARSACW